MSKKLSTIFLTGSVLVLGACTHVQSEAKYPTGYDRTETNGNIYAKRQSIMGDHGFCLGGSDERSHMEETAPEIFGKAQISLASAVKTAEQKTKGRAFDAEINDESNLPRYEVKILKNGKILEVLVNAKTGTVLNISSNK